MTRKVAVVTGGTSGIGLAITQALSARSDWVVFAVGMDEDRGLKVAALGSNVVFCRADVRDFSSLGNVFQKAFQSQTAHRIDFVFANAGTIEKKDFYGPTVPHSCDHLPPKPDLESIETNLNETIVTCYLAKWYLSQNSESNRQSCIVVTSSCGGIYPSYYSPLYTAAKHGIIGFIRAASPEFANNNIRLNAICPGVVKTNLVSDWSGFPEDVFTPMSTILQILTLLIDADTVLVDARNAVVPRASLSGLVIEISRDRFYLREKPEFLDDNMMRVMGATEPDQQRGRILKL